MAQEYSLDSGKTSEFNEAILKMKRIDRSQLLISMHKLNMLKYHTLLNKYYYEIVITELLNLCQEAKGKFNSTEKEKADEFRNKITMMLEDNPIFPSVKKSTIKGMKKTKRLDYESWKKLRDIIFALEDFVADMLESHGFTSRNTDDEELWD